MSTNKKTDSIIRGTFVVVICSNLYKSIMKKAIGILFCASLILASFSSCTKKCKCTTYINDEFKSEKTVKREKGKDCSDMSTILTVEGAKTGVECNPTVSIF